MELFLDKYYLADNTLNNFTRTKSSVGIPRRALFTLRQTQLTLSVREYLTMVGL